MFLMVKTILLKVNEDFFYKMKEDKLQREKKVGHQLNWEEYIQVLFSFSASVKFNIGERRLRQDDTKNISSN